MGCWACRAGETPSSEMFNLDRISNYYVSYQYYTALPSPCYSWLVLLGQSSSPPCYVSPLSTILSFLLILPKLPSNPIFCISNSTHYQLSLPGPFNLKLLLVTAYVSSHCARPYVVGKDRTHVFWVTKRSISQ